MKTGNRLAALVIEDDVEMAGQLRKLLRGRFSMDVELAHDCATARRLLAEKEFDLITLDYRLPDGAGLDLLDEITDSVEHPPVIMVTGYGDEEIAARSFRSRACGYVVKDESLPETLGEAVKKAIAQISLQKVERELLDEKLFIEHTLNSLPDVFAVVDLDGNFFRWNSRLNEVSGYSDAEITSMHMVDMFRREDGDTALDGMRRMLEESFGIDRVTLKTKSGQEILYELNGTLLRDYDGNPIGFCGIGRDVSGRGVPVEDRLRLQLGLEVLVKDSASELRAAGDELREALVETARAGEALRSSERYYHSILDNSIDIIAIFDAAGNMMEISPSVERVLGRAPSEVTGREVFEMVHPEDAAGLRHMYLGLVSDPGGAGTVESRFRHIDGSWHIFEVVGRSFMMEEGAVRVVVNARDITGRKRSEEELRSLNRELEGFAQTVSHDLRTPLTSIKLAGDTLARMWRKREQVEELGPEVERIAEVISLSASQAEALIEDLLQLARAGQQPEEVVPVDISTVVARVLDERSAMIEERGTRVAADESLGIAGANPSHMYQLFGNIVDNAIRHNRNPEPVVWVRYLGSDDGGHHYSVEDNGPGIPPEDRENVFLPFFKGEGGSTGIGLAIVRKLVNLYDGSIEVAGDAGSRFDFTISDLPNGV